jgi:hypothetical protein
MTIDSGVQGHAKGLTVEVRPFRWIGLSVLVDDFLFMRSHLHVMPETEIGRLRESTDGSAPIHDDSPG